MNPFLPFGGVIPPRGRPPNPQNGMPIHVGGPRRPNRYVPPPSTREFLVTLQNYVGTQVTISVAIGDLVTKYVIAKESNAENEGYHFHMYLHTRRDFPLIRELREHLRIRLFANIPEVLVSINIKSLDTPKSVARALKYVSKGDRYCLVLNVAESKLHLYFRTHSWVRRTRVFDELHPFFFEYVVTLKHRKEDLLSMHQAYWGAVALANQLERHRNQGREFLDNHFIRPNTWVSLLQDWCTDMLQLPFDRPTENPKLKCLFLWGHPGHGKTHTLESLLPELCTHAYFPSTIGNFMFTGLRACHKAIYFSDAYPELWECLPVREMLLRLTESKNVAIEMKHKDPIPIEFHGPVFIVSNFGPPPNEGYQRAFHRRFTIIHAERSWDQCVEHINVIPETQPPPPQPLQLNLGDEGPANINEQEPNGGNDEEHFVDYEWLNEPITQN